MSDYLWTISNDDHYIECINTADWGGFPCLRWLDGEMWVRFRGGVPFDVFEIPKNWELCV